MNIDPNDLLSLLEDLPDETIAHLCDFLRDLADAIENRYCARLINYDHRSYQRQATAEERASEHDPEHLDHNQPPF